MECLVFHRLYVIREFDRNKLQRLFANMYIIFHEFNARNVSMLTSSNCTHVFRCFAFRFLRVSCLISVFESVFFGWYFRNLIRREWNHNWMTLKARVKKKHHVLTYIELLFETKAFRWYISSSPRLGRQVFVSRNNFNAIFSLQCVCIKLLTFCIWCVCVWLNNNVRKIVLFQSESES